mgnify:CR=1 FL=1
MSGHFDESDPAIYRASVIPCRALVGYHHETGRAVNVVTKVGPCHAKAIAGLAGDDEMPICAAHEQMFLSGAEILMLVGGMAAWVSRIPE